MVRRLYPCPATLLAGHRGKPAIPVLELGEPGVGRVRDRPGQRRRFGWVFDITAIRRRSGLHLLVLAAMAATLCADLSMLSKAETERIWLPFMVWLTAAPALLPRSSHRWWLAVNVIGALAINHFILTNW